MTDRNADILAAAMERLRTDDEFLDYEAARWRTSGLQVCAEERVSMDHLKSLTDRFLAKNPGLRETIRKHHYAQWQKETQNKTP